MAIGYIIGLLLTAATGIGAYYLLRRNYDLASLVAFFLACVGAVLFFTISAAASWDEEIQKEQRFEAPIIALRNDSLVSGYVGGGIFVVVGSVAEEPVYFYYAEEPDGAILQYHITTRDTKIYEEPREDGVLTTVKTYEEKPVSQFGKWWFDLKEPAIDNVSYTYEFHVPENTVARQFEVR